MTIIHGTKRFCLVEDEPVNMECRPCYQENRKPEIIPGSRIRDEENGWIGLCWKKMETVHGANREEAGRTRTEQEKEKRNMTTPSVQGFITAGRGRRNSHDEEEDCPPAYTCPECGSDFCDHCTDMEAWLSDLVKICPHCGHIPGRRPEHQAPGGQSGTPEVTGYILRASDAGREKNGKSHDGPAEARSRGVHLRETQLGVAPPCPRGEHRASIRPVEAAP